MTDKNVIQFTCNVAVAHLLNHIRKDTPVDIRSTHEGPMGLEAGEYKLHYSYRYEYPTIIINTTLTPDLTLLEFLKMAALHFERCFGVMFKDTGSCVVPPHRTDWEVLLKSYTKGVQDGECVSTPFFEIINVNTKTKTIDFFLGT